MPRTFAYLLFLMLLASTAVAGNPKILVINSYHEEFSWQVSHNEAIKEGLADIADLTFFNLDTKRLHPAHYPGRASLALERFKDLQPDLVILADDNALCLLGHDITKNGTPVVYLGINANPRTYLGDTTLMTGVLERPLLKRSIVFIKAILARDIDKCLVLFDSGTTAEAALDTVFKGKNNLEFDHTSTDVHLVAKFSNWKKHVLTASDYGYDAIILGLYHTLTDDEGNHVPSDVIAEWTSANTPLPIFGFWDYSIGKGKALGGLVLAGRPQGEEAVKLVKRILAGEHPSDIPPVMAEHGRFLFSRSEMEHWDITLPSNLALPNETLEFVD